MARTHNAHRLPRGYRNLLNALHALVKGKVRRVKVIDPDPYMGGTFTIVKKGKNLVMFSPLNEVIENTPYLEPILFFFGVPLSRGELTIEIEA